MKVNGPPRAESRTMRVGFELDLARCVGCGACSVACRIENELPPGVSWRRVLQVNRSRVDGGPTYHLSVACHHCMNPPCARACPTGALEKDVSGLVKLVPDRCIGCRYCEMACPYGAPSFDEARGVMTKCHLCSHRLEDGLSPACVASCPTGALGFFHARGAEGLPHQDPGESRERAGKGRSREFVPAEELPGFGDPVGAEPGLRLKEPGGAIRSRWFQELRALLGREEENERARS